MIDKVGNEAKFDSGEQRGRYIESRLVETGILECLKEVYDSCLENNNIGQTVRIRDAKNMLMTNLEQKYNSWQSFYDDRPGLNSRGVGEAITRMVGSGILEDFPEVNKMIPGDVFNHGTNIPVQPKSKTDKRVVEVTILVGKAAENIFAKFTFNTSSSEIENRHSVLMKEIKKARNMTDEDFNYR